MTSIELAKSIFEKAVANGKQAWLSEKQSKFLFSLLSKEGRLQETAKIHFIAYIKPSGEWVKDMKLAESIEIGQENIQTIRLVPPAHYIKRNGFNAYKLDSERLIII